MVQASIGLRVRGGPLSWSPVGRSRVACICRSATATCMNHSAHIHRLLPGWRAAALAWPEHHGKSSPLMEFVPCPRHPVIQCGAVVNSNLAFRSRLTSNFTCYKVCGDLGFAVIKLHVCPELKIAGLPRVEVHAATPREKMRRPNLQGLWLNLRFRRYPAIRH